MSRDVSPEPLLAVRDLRTAFSTSGGEVVAVDGVSLQLAAGQTLGIVGESGSGKSVLGRSIMGLISEGSDTSVTGSVVLSGTDIRALAPARRRKFWGTDVAMVFQDPMTSLNPVKRVGKHLTEALRLRMGMSKTAAKERAIRLLEQVGIPEPGRRFGQYPHELSGGMRQRVVIAMGLACEPKVLIADEPTTALDVTVQKQILDLLDSLRRELNMAMLLISHDLGVVAGRSDQVAVMYAGRMVEHAATERLFEGARHPYTEALIDSIPRLEHAPHTELRAVGGAPPNMADPPQGCRFAPRCRYARDVCAEETPELTVDAARHGVACHFPLAGAVSASDAKPRAGTEPTRARQ